MGIPAIKCEHCGVWFSPVHSELHCEELKTVLQQQTVRLKRKQSLLNDIIFAHRRLVLGESAGMSELDEFIRSAAEDAGYTWAIQNYSSKNE